MRSILLAAGAALVLTAGAIPAFAGADDGGTKAFWLAEANPAPATTTNRSARYTATYVEPKASEVARTNPAAVDPVPPAFYHAMGTMGVP